MTPCFARPVRRRPNMPRLCSGSVRPKCGFRSFRSRDRVARPCALRWWKPDFSTADMAKKKDPDHRVVADNRKARHLYFIESTLEAGLMLMGSEVKSLRGGQANIAESYAHAKDGEIFLVNAYIPEYTMANRFNHEPRRVRKLLVRKAEARKLVAAVQREGMTLVPLKVYFTPKGIAKIELGIAKGKKLHDKRQTEKARDWDRDKARLMRAKG